MSSTAQLSVWNPHCGLTVKDESAADSTHSRETGEPISSFTHPATLQVAQPSPATDREWKHFNPHRFTSLTSLSLRNNQTLSRGSAFENVDSKQNL